MAKFRAVGVMAAVFVLVAIGTYVGIATLGERDNAVSSATAQGELKKGSHSAGQQTEIVAPPSTSLDDHPTKGPTAVDMSSVSPAAHPTDTEPARADATKDHNHGGEFSSELIVNGGRVSATSEVSRPFPLSQSLKTTCAGANERPGSDCIDAQNALTAMAKESRDSVWSIEMERRIRDGVMGIDSGRFTIRSLECRTTYCAAEVASIGGNYDCLGLFYKLKELYRFASLDYAWAIEKDKDLIPIAVIVYVLKR